MRPVYPLRFPLLLATAFVVAAAAVDITDNAKRMFTRPLAFVEQCYENRLECRACRSQCPSALHTFFKPSRSDVNVISLLRACRLEISARRTGMDAWCINDKKRFFATNEFRPTTESCKMDPIVCADHVLDWARDEIRARRMHTRHEDVVLAHKMAEVAAAIRKEKISKARLDVAKKERLQNKEWYRTRILNEMQKHIFRPYLTNTQFSDPVFTDLDKLLKKTRSVDQSLYRNDLFSSSIENQFVKKDTVEQIPRMLYSISQVIDSSNVRSAEINGYLRDIKASLQSTHQAQLAATDIVYESTHVKDLKGEIVLLDKELLKLFSQLKRERATLSEATNRAIRNRHQLVTVMRSMIMRISIAQKRNRCSDTFFNPATA